MYNKLIINIKPLGFTWETMDPFLFCVHHKDNYPAGNVKLGPAASLESRYLEQDFTAKDGWPWSRYDNVHPREKGRFAKYSDGREEIR